MATEHQRVITWFEGAGRGGERLQRAADVLLHVMIQCSR